MMCHRNEWTRREGGGIVREDRESACGGSHVGDGDGTQEDTVGQEVGQRTVEVVSTARPRRVSQQHLVRQRCGLVAGRYPRRGLQVRPRVAVSFQRQLQTTIDCFYNFLFLKLQFMRIKMYILK